ncbi:hypothetical protein [Thalassotalea sp. PP2-459]|uniref:hypothetical protein n=1 Tax=Thalassotalea sp. PP2-459 TaxID=1742724 RepID=UPI0009420F96|nr:hypothetical protein [Thalassotalea sp. PP2-459]OKY26294.1 hypothetical protein BI291_12860 [Thalassotalea sp. PP2-459]
MKYTFDFRGEKYTLLNFWFSDVSIILLCRGKEIFRVNRDNNIIKIKEKFSIMTDDGELVIDTTSKMFKVEIKITDDENNVIPMEKSTISIFNFLRSINVSWDLSFKNKWACPLPH